jgi:hypothetical protein
MAGVGRTRRQGEHTGCDLPKESMAGLQLGHLTTVGKQRETHTGYAYKHASPT